MPVPRTRDQLKKAAADAEALVDRLEAEGTGVRLDGPADLRQIARALHAVVDAEKMLTLAVGSARANGRSWNEIARVLGMSRQATQKRYDLPGAVSSGDAVTSEDAGTSARRRRR